MLSKMTTYIMAAPLGQPLMPPKDRPMISSSEVNSVRRNLFGSCPSGDIDAQLKEGNERESEYLQKRYNIKIEELECNQKISRIVTVNGIKTKFCCCCYHVRKNYNGDSKVPKRKLNVNHEEADSHNREIGASGAKRMCKDVSNDGNN